MSEIQTSHDPAQSEPVQQVRSTCATRRPPDSVYEIYWDAGQPDCLEGGSCSNTRDAVDVTHYGLRGTNWGFRIEVTADPT